jgi:DNA-binding response OmpR family regulator
MAATGGTEVARVPVPLFPRERVALGELHLARRRLDELLATVAVLLQVSEEPAAWERVGQAVRLGQRALSAAIGAVPPLPVTPAPAAELQVGELVIDTVAGRQWYAGREFWLTPLRRRLLVTMAAAPTRVFAKDELRREVWGYQGIVQGRTVDTAVAKLRRDLIAAGAPPHQHLVCLRGIGWTLNPRTDDAPALDMILAARVRR